jgi:site-specific recombinase XerD
MLRMAQSKSEPDAAPNAALDAARREAARTEVDPPVASEVASASAEIVPDIYIKEKTASRRLLPAHGTERFDEGESTDPALAYLASLAPTGRRMMRMRLERVALLLTGRQSLRAIRWEKLGYEHVAAIRSLLQEQGLAPASVNAALYALRGVAKAAWNMDLMSAENYARIRNVKPVRGTRLPAGRNVASGELSALLEACSKDSSPAGTRDAALIGVLYCGGLRRAEAAGLDVEDYEYSGGALSSGALKVRGKGDKERLAYIVGGAGEALRDWLDWRGAGSFVEELERGGTPAEGTPALPRPPLPGPSLSGSATGHSTTDRSTTGRSTTDRSTTDRSSPLFCPIRKNGAIVARRMTDQAIYLILQKRALEARVLHFSPHDLRRTFVGDLLDRDVDIVTVQQMAGHANVSTTARYDRRGERAKAKAADKLHLPYRKRSLTL